MIRVLDGDCRTMLETLPAASVQMVCTSPPYFGLRDYGTAQWEGGDPACDHTERNARNDISPDELARRAAAYGTGTGSGSAVPRVQYRSICGKCGARRIDNQIGMEQSPDAYVSALVEVFRGVKRVLRDDGLLFLNLGDSYGTGNSGKMNRDHSGGLGAETRNEWSQSAATANCGRAPVRGFHKQLLGIPWRVAFALQADGWYLRSAIVWHKPNPMPESCTDRCTSSYEMVFMLAKAERYFYDANAVAEDAIVAGKERVFGRQKNDTAAAMGRDRHTGNMVPGMRAMVSEKRNARNVWTIATTPTPFAHFATMPPELAERCILAGSRPGDTVLDPFSGAGTTLLVADRLQRDAVGIELSPTYAAMARDRVSADAPLFAAVAD